MEPRLHRIDPVITELKSIYKNPKRTYHNLDHIYGMLDGLEESRHLTQHFLRVELAIWFHDAVYNTKETDNEVKSANLWMRKMPLFLDEDSLEWGRRAILATIDHLPNADPDIQLLLDLDLAPLGVSYEAFKAAGEAIRLEYSHVPALEFHIGRQAFLAKIFDRPRIYGTDLWYNRLETRARNNIERTLR